VSPDDKTLIALGLIIKPRGLSGEVVVRPFNEDNPSLCRDLPVIIETKQESFPTTAENVNKIGNKLMVKFAGIDSRERAEECRGGEILSRLGDLPPKGKDEFYIFDLVGLNVLDADNAIFGKIKDILNMPANDVLVIESLDGDVLVPFIQGVIDKIDMAGGQVTISRVREFML
jgi:16S rRNA processing protein RimM